MRILRMGPAGAERPAIFDNQGVVRDISSLVDDITPAWLARSGWRDIDPLVLPQLPALSVELRVGAPVAGIGKIVCVGLNYSDHAAETGQAIPREPILFSKSITSLQGPDDPVRIPRGGIKTDWEVELAVIIGREARYVALEEALDHVAGYSVMNDVSERAFQLERGGQWLKGKGCDTFGPLGPWLVTRDEIPDPQALDMWLDVNDERVQSGSTSTMIFDVAYLVHYISGFFTLMPGDVISTGTPPGVGMGFSPPRFLKAGDVMRLGIGGLGQQRQMVIAHDAV